MSELENFPKLTLHQRQSRYFSETIKRKIVADIDKKIVTIAEISRSYQVSRTSVQRWIYKYSLMKKQGKRMIVEAESDTRKIDLLQQKIKELEQIVGKKQIKIDFLEKMIDLTEKDLNIDIKKKENQ